jgi:DNA-binding protein HU-beta
MNKSEFIEAVYKNGDYETKADAARAYDSVLQAMVTRLTKGAQKDRVLRLPELGTFKLKTRKARKGRNPQTGETIKIGSKKVVSFKTGKNLSDNL